MVSQSSERTSVTPRFYMNLQWMKVWLNAASAIELSCPLQVENMRWFVMIIRTWNWQSLESKPVETISREYDGLFITSAFSVYRNILYTAETKGLVVSCWNVTSSGHRMTRTERHTLVWYIMAMIYPNIRALHPAHISDACKVITDPLLISCGSVWPEFVANMEFFVGGHANYLILWHVLHGAIGDN